MDWKTAPPEGHFPAADLAGDGFHRGSSSSPGTSQKVESKGKDPIAARKVQKADREKLRRDRLNEQFLELGKALDPDRPKNDKATILTDTIQVLKDLTSQVGRLKAEYTSLSEESHELTLEKNELREEKTTLKSDIDNLNIQYQQRLRCMYPWATMDPSVVMGPPPPYPYPMPVPIHSAPIPIHPSMQPYPFFPSQNPGVIPNPCPAYVPFLSPLNPQLEQSSSQRIPAHQHASSSKSHTTSRQDSRSKSSEHQHQCSTERSDDYSDVVTELELKTPGSAPSHSKVGNDKGLSSEEMKEKQWLPERNENSVADGNSNRNSSSSGPPDSPSNSVGDGSVSDN